MVGAVARNRAWTVFEESEHLTMPEEITVRP
jgi:hypothetical protein